MNTHVTSGNLMFDQLWNTNKKQKNIEYPILPFLVEENNDDISLDDLVKIGPNITTMSPMVTGGVQNGSDVKIDVSDPETFSVPASTEMPGLVPNSTSVVGTTVIPPSKYCECNHLYYDLIDHEVMVAYCSPVHAR